jgi:hypothetical protein
MLTRALRQPVSVDVAPQGSKCIWCSKPATMKLTIRGEGESQAGGPFCQHCGVEFICIVADSLERVITADEAVDSGV